MYTQNVENEHTHCTCQWVSKTAVWGREDGRGRLCVHCWFSFSPARGEKLNKGSSYLSTHRRCALTVSLPRKLSQWSLYSVHPKADCGKSYALAESVNHFPFKKCYHMVKDRRRSGSASS